MNMYDGREVIDSHLNLTLTYVLKATPQRPAVLFTLGEDDK